MLRRTLITLMLASPLGATPFASRAAAATHEFEPATLRWTRAQDAAICPDEWEVARAVEARLGPGALVPPASAKLVVEASIRARSEGGFEIEIALLRGDTVVGRRELSSPEPNCSAATEEAALVIALAIDPEASASDPPPTSVRVPEPVTAPHAPAPESSHTTTPPAALPGAPESSSAAPSSAPPAPAWQGDLEIAAGAATGIVPEIAPGFFWRGRGRPPRLALAFELEGAYFPPSDVELAPGRGAHFALWYVGAALCNRSRRAAPLRWSVCGGADFAATTGQGRGFESTPHFSSYALLLAARGRLGVRMARAFALVLGPDVLVPFPRDRFVAITAAGTEPLFRMKPVGFGFEVGVVWEL